MRLKFSTGKMQEVLPEIPDNHFTAAVADPPYGTAAVDTLGWNKDVTSDQMAHVLRVLKPGAFFLAFGSPSRHHRMMVAMEDAGFEIHDMLLWLFGDRMPKARDAGKQLGDERWNDYHPHIRQAYEPIIVARKPTGLNYHRNAAEHGTGVLNVGRTRIPLLPGEVKGGFIKAVERKNMFKPLAHVHPKQDIGRFPSNLLLDESFAMALDDQTISNGKSGYENRHSYRFQMWAHRMVKAPSLGSTGDGGRGPVSRFFYCPKAAGKERDVEFNDNSCVKPLALMRWLVSLVLYPGENNILDPYCGSGTTALAIRSILYEEKKLKCGGLFIDQDPKQVKIAKRRLRQLARNNGEAVPSDGKSPYARSK